MNRTTVHYVWAYEKSHGKNKLGQNTIQPEQTGLGLGQAGDRQARLEPAILVRIGGTQWEKHLNRAGLKRGTGPRPRG